MIYEGKNTNNPTLFTDSGLWVRFDKYGLKWFTDCYGKKELFIMPSKNAHIEYYRPFEKFPDILNDIFAVKKLIPKDFLRSDCDISLIKEADKLIIGNEIVNFAKKYGLLGLIFNDAYEFRNSDECQYMKFYFPENTSIADNYLEFLDMGEIVPDVQFWVNYSERMETILIEMFKFYEHLEAWGKVEDGKELPSKFSESFITNDIKLSVTFNKVWQLDVKFRSLFDALYSMFAFHITSVLGHKNKLYLKHCKNPKCNVEPWFIAKNPKQQYCSDTCSSYVRVNKYLKKKEEKENDTGKA
jgi:hypothetical protein